MSFIVDDPKHRKEEGAEFSSKLSNFDIRETKKNMLGKAILHANKFPEITIESIEVSGSHSVVQSKARITIRGVSNIVKIPGIIKIDGNRLRGTSQVSIRQTDFGIEPFSLLFGTIKVMDELLIKIDVTGIL